MINPGAGVVTTRGHVHWVVTEYGAVDLFGKTLRQRAELLVLEQLGEDRASRLSRRAAFGKLVRDDEARPGRELTELSELRGNRSDLLVLAVR